MLFCVGSVLVIVTIVPCAVSDDDAETPVVPERVAVPAAERSNLDGQASARE
jgi:hypothetical protein